jgi:hypothetical protein
MKFRTIAAAALTAAALTVGTTTVAPPAQAANPGCMSRAEYQKIKKGMSPTKVKRIVGSAGRLAMDAGWMKIRQFDTCGNPYGIGQVSYVRGRVDSKLYIV